MFAYIRQGSKQRKVTLGCRLKFDTIEGQVGDIITFNEVLLVGSEKAIQVGQPTVSGAQVQGRIVTQGQSPKVIVFKKLRRKGFHKKQGHRQDFTEVEITEITE